MGNISNIINGAIKVFDDSVYYCSERYGTHILSFKLINSIS